LHARALAHPARAARGAVRGAERLRGARSAHEARQYRHPAGARRRPRRHRRRRALSPPAPPLRNRVTGDFAMNSKVLYALSAVTAVLIGATVYLTPAPISERVAPGERLFANLDPNTINSAASLTVTARGKTFTVYRKDGAWVVKEMADYPADTSQIR